jgi:hypothetical protein
MVFLSTVFLAGSAWAQADPNLVGSWTFDEGGGTTVVDSSSHGNDGTIQAGTLGNLEFVPGISAFALRFPGDDQGWVELPPDIVTPAQGSVAMWINTSQSDNEGMLWYGTETGGDGYGDQNEMHLTIDNVGTGQLDLRLEGSPDRTLDYDNIGGTGWRHVAATWDLADGLRLYVDGEEVDSAAHNDNVFNFAVMRLGRPVSTGNGNRYYDGLMDEVRLYDRVISAAEVAALAVRSKAWNPDPTDGADDVEVPLLRWEAAGVASFQKVYVSADAEITEADLVAPMLPAAMKIHPLFGSPLFGPGATIYWRVDAIKGDMSVVEGDVWMFSVPPTEAWGPSPATGTPFVVPDTELTWRKGFGALTHDVYLGTDADEVAAGAEGTSQGNVLETLFATGPLDNGTTYYWRVDEIDLSGAVTPGEVWSFTTIPVIGVVDPDLLAWYKLDEGVGTAAVDHSGNNRHASFADPAPTWALGRINGALEFAGNGDSAVHADGSFINGLDALTVTAWVKSDIVNTDRGFIIFEQPVGADDVDMRYDEAGATGGADDVLKMGLTVQIDPDNTQIIQLESSENSQTTEWQHVALVWASGEQMQFYIDGELDIPTAIAPAVTGTLTTFDTVILGKGGKDEGGILSWDGLLDDVRIYGVALSQAEIQEAMRGDPLHAWDPNPTDGATTDAFAASPLTWEPGVTAVEHDVYLTADPNAIADANTSDTTGVYRGRQAAASYTPDPRLEWGQDYFWRIDEIDNEQTVIPGRVWSFSLNDFVTVDDFESYTNNSPDRVFQAWIDGLGFSADEWFPNGNPGNGTGAIVGNDPLAGDIMETANVHGGGQAMPMAFSGAVSEATRTFTPAQDWSVDGITALVLFVREDPANAGGDLYIKINNEKVPLVDNGTYPPGFDPGYVQYNVDLTTRNVSNVRSLTVGVEGPATAQGEILVDDILLYREAPAPLVLTFTSQIIEAESGAITAPFEVLSNIPGASGGQYIMVPDGVGGSGGAPAAADDGWAVYTIDIPADGDYVIALLGLRQNAGDGGDDSFWVSVPSAVLGAPPFTPPDWIRCGGVFPTDEQDVMVWDFVRDWFGSAVIPDTDPVIFTLTAGQHELRISRREDGTGLDAIAIFLVE